MIAVVMLLPFTLGLIVAGMLGLPLAYRAGVRAERRDAADVARILAGFDAPPVERQAITWREPTAAHASLRVASPPPDYQGKHAAGALVRAHLMAIGAAS